MSILITGLAIYLVIGLISATVFAMLGGMHDGTVAEFAWFVVFIPLVLVLFGLMMLFILSLFAYMAYCERRNGRAEQKTYTLEDVACKEGDVPSKHLTKIVGALWHGCCFLVSIAFVLVILGCGNAIEAVMKQMRLASCLFCLLTGKGG